MFSAKHARTEVLRLTQSQLAERLGVDQAAVSRWEAAEKRGEDLDVRTQLAIEALMLKQGAA